VKAGGVKPTPKKKPQIAEQHFDDCGEDFSTLEDDPDGHLLSCVEELEEIDDSMTCLISWRFGLGGSRALLTSKHDCLVTPVHTTHYHDMPAFNDGWTNQARPHHDVEVVELCGGEFGHTHLLVRRTNDEQCERYAHATFDATDQQDIDLLETIFMVRRSTGGDVMAVIC